MELAVEAVPPTAALFLSPVVKYANMPWFLPRCRCRSIRVTQRVGRETL